MAGWLSFSRCTPKGHHFYDKIRFLLWLINIKGREKNTRKEGRIISRSIHFAPTHCSQIEEEKRIEFCFSGD